jgi:cytochrome c553
MKKLTLVSLIAAAFLFTACEKEAPAETNTTVAEENTTVAPEVNETVPPEVNETVAPEANATPETAPTADAGAVDGAAAYAACSACHGADGKGTIGGAKVLAGKDAAYVVEKLKAYKAGTITSPTAAVMNGQAAALDDATMQALGDHVATLK